MSCNMLGKRDLHYFVTSWNFKNHDGDYLQGCFSPLLESMPYRIVEVLCAHRGLTRYYVDVIVFHPFTVILNIITSSFT